MYEFQRLCGGFQVVEIIKLCNVALWLLNKMECNFIDWCANLVPV
jgi:hypothetical protein